MKPRALISVAAMCLCISCAASCTINTDQKTTASAAAAAPAVTSVKETTDMKTEQTTVSAAGTETAEAVNIDTTEPLYFAPGIWQSVGNAPYEVFYYFDGQGKGESRMQQDGRKRNFTYRFENGKLVLRSDGNTNDLVAEITEKGEGVLLVSWDLIQSQTIKYLGGFDFNWFSFYTTEQIKEMATEYFVSRNGFEPEKVEAYVNQDEKINVDITEYIYTGDDVPKCDYTYIVDRFTAKGVMIGGYGEDIPIDLMDMSYPEPITPAGWNSGAAERSAVLDADKKIGEMFLGFIGEDDDIKEILGRSGAAEKFSFLSELPEDRVIRTKLGKEVYLVIPADQNSEVTVTELLYDDDTFSDIPDETIYHSSDGAPFIVVCNATPRRSDVQISIIDSSGSIFEIRPALFTGENDEKTLLDSDGIIYSFN